MSEQYEFSEVENRTIGTSASRATAWGVISIVIGVLQVLTSLSKAAGFMGAITLAGGVVGVVVGIVFLGVGKTLKGVVDTKGNDISLMMGALQRLSTAFMIQIAVTCLGFALGFVAGAMGIIK